MITIRPETPEHHDAVSRVNRQAFARESEARLVEALRASPAYIPELSLVALEGTAVVGHILFSRVTVNDHAVARAALALAPMAVVPDRQNHGIGSALVRRGIQDARALGHQVVIVLGHSKYYPRFGFVPAQPLGILPPFDAPVDAFLVLGLQEHALKGSRGRVEYPPAFSLV